MEAKVQSRRRTKSNLERFLDWDAEGDEMKYKSIYFQTIPPTVQTVRVFEILTNGVTSEVPVIYFRTHAGEFEIGGTANLELLRTAVQEALKERA